MKSRVHDVVGTLMKLASLEERLTTFPPDREEQTNVEGLIESLRANLPVRVLIAHDQLQALGKHSEAEVRDGVCSGCHVALAVGNTHEIKSGSLRQCDKCWRFLYVVEDGGVKEGAAPAPTPPLSRVVSLPKRHGVSELI